MDNEKLEGLKLSDEELNAVNGGVNLEGELASAASGKNLCTHFFGLACFANSRQECSYYQANSDSIYCVKPDINL